MDHLNYETQFPPPFNGEFDFENIAQVSSTRCSRKLLMSLKYANTTDENGTQEMQHLLGANIPFFGNLFPAQQIQNELDVPPELGDGGINDPTSKTPIKASIGGTTRKRGRPRNDSVEGPVNVKKVRTRKGEAMEKENRPPKAVDVDERDIFLAKGRVWSAEDKTNVDSTKPSALIAIVSKTSSA